ncbi:L-ribulose-5-phosphate 4-epimerase [Actinobacillus equuli]|nr:L-ribulose-5-phosphate 4-epimerase [Actinobacillus equuli]
MSEIDRETGYVAIKPSGVEYETMKPEDIVFVDLQGNKVFGDKNLRPIPRPI